MTNTNKPAETETYIVLVHGRFLGCRKTLAAAQSACRRFDRDAGRPVSEIRIGVDPRKPGGSLDAARPL